MQSILMAVSDLIASLIMLISPKQIDAKFDKTEVTEMMRMFRDEADLPEYLDAEDDSYWNLLLDTMLAGKGVIFLEEGKGLLMAIIHPTIWSNKVNTMQELAWYVKPEFRHTTIGYRLLKAYIEYGDGHSKTA